MIKREIITLFFVIFGVTSLFAQSPVSDTSLENEVSDTDVIQSDVQEEESVEEIDEEIDEEAAQLADQLNNMEVKSVSNIRVRMNSSNNLDIMYDLSELSDVSIYFSTDNGASYYGPIYLVSGAIGASVEAGSNKSVSWNIKSEMGEINVEQARIKIVAKRVKPKVDWTNTFLFGATLAFPGDDVEMSSMPISVMYGGYKRAGIYTRVAMSLSQPSGESYYDVDQIFYDGTGTQSLMMASFGLLFRLGDFGALGFGASGAMRKLYANSTSGSTIDYATDMLVGGEMSLIVNVKFMSLGVTGIYFDGMTAVNAGIGINF